MGVSQGGWDIQAIETKKLQFVTIERQPHQDDPTLRLFSVLLGSLVFRIPPTCAFVSNITM